MCTPAYTEIIATLKQVLIFRDLPPEDLLLLANSAHVKAYHKGTTICKRSEPAHCLHIILSGRVSEFVVDDHELSCVARLNHPFDYFGELGLLLNDPYATTSVAATATEILLIPKDVFCQIALNRHEVIRAIVRRLTTRLQKSGEKTISFIHFNAEGRLAYNLLQMRDKQGHVVTTQESLSVECGIVRQTVSAILNEFKRIGAIDIQRGKIFVRDPECLAGFFMDDQNMR